MTTYLLLTLDEAAAASALEVAVVRRCAEAGLVAPRAGYGEEDLAELRRVRRLIDDLELGLPAVEVVLHMRRQMLALRAEVARLEAELRRFRHPAAPLHEDGEWDELI
jgi:hypothetical protein